MLKSYVICLTIMQLIDCITIISIDHKLHISYVLPLTRNLVTLIRPVDSFMTGIRITSSYQDDKQNISAINVTQSAIHQAIKMTRVDARIR